MTSLLTDVENALRAIGSELHAKGDELITQHAAVVHDAAETVQKLTSSRIVTEVMQYGEDILPTSTVDAVVALVHDAGEAAARIAQLTAPPPPPPAEPEQPVQ